jgi:hypothetical protein
MQKALLQIDDLTRKKKALEEHLRLTAAGREVGRGDMVLGHLKGGECCLYGCYVYHILSYFV